MMTDEQQALAEAVAALQCIHQRLSRQRTGGQSVSEKKELSAADRPSDDPLTQRYRTALAKLNQAPVANMTLSDLDWVKPYIKARWQANAHQWELELPSRGVDNVRIVERLEALVRKCCS